MMKCHTAARKLMIVPTSIILSAYETSRRKVGCEVSIHDNIEKNKHHPIERSINVLSCNSTRKGHDIR